MLKTRRRRTLFLSAPHFCPLLRKRSVSCEKCGTINDWAAKPHCGTTLRVVNFLVAEVARLQNSPRKLNSGEFSYQFFHSLSAS